MPGPVSALVDDGVAVLRLADQEHRNALSLEMTRALAATVGEVLADPTVGAMVVAADGPVFSAGGSVDDLLAPRAPLEEMYAGFLAVAEAPVPTVAAVAGPAVGAGVNVALACDVILCSPEARFDPRFLDVGIHPGGGILWRLRERVGRQAAAAMVLCGESVDGEEAARLGLAWRCVPADRLEEAAVALARRAAGRPSELVRRTKAVLDSTAGATTSTEAVALELEPQRWSMQQPFFQDRLDQLRARLGRT